MSYLVVLSVIVAAVSGQLLTPDEVEKLKSYHASCLKETGIDESLVKKAMTGEYTDDPKFKDHLLCCHKKIGFQNDAGDINEEAIIKKVSMVFKNEEVVKLAVQKCSKKQATPSETAYEFAKCMHAFAPKDLDIVSMFY
ncbi:B1 protein [Anthonomus grandis grandis]|uniref:Putative odorant-binding protein 23 n=1 Tax=Anthonomus grandis TaxID=7044 RepID=A0A2P9JZF8_ANTGR|nr:B1 protein [Anthonomus grandis grandis]AVI04900.1 putative odorant-binding protein 23 [Anthonomus grandis]